MTYEDFLRLQGQQPGFGFGTLGGDQTTPAPVPPITEVPAPQNIPQMPGQPVDWKQLVQAKALQMLNAPEQKPDYMTPLSMSLMAIGQQLQTPKYLRGQDNNLQTMANALLAWQLRQQNQGEMANYRRAQALNLLGKLATEPGSDADKVVGPLAQIWSSKEQKYVYPEVNPTRRALLESQRTAEQAALEKIAQQYGYNKELLTQRGQQAIQQIQERANKAPKEFSPELVDLEGGGVGLLDKSSGNITPIKGAVGKNKAGADIDVRNRALKLTVDSGIFPDDPKFDEIVDQNIKRLKGIAPQKQTQFSIPTTGLKEGQRAKGSDGNIYVVKNGQWTKE